MKKNLNVIFKQEADIEVLEAFNYYEDELEGLGERFLDELDKVILSINLTPNGFQQFHTYRQVPFNVFPFLLIYEVIENNLIVYAVFKTPQDPKKKIR